jgi:hypothetical protein
VAIISIFSHASPSNPNDLKARSHHHSSACHEDHGRFLHALGAQRRYPCIWWSQAAQAHRRAQVTRYVVVPSQFQSKIDEMLSLARLLLLFARDFSEQSRFSHLNNGKSRREAARRGNLAGWLDM